MRRAVFVSVHLTNEVSTNRSTRGQTWLDDRETAQRVRSAVGASCVSLWSTMSLVSLVSAVSHVSGLSGLTCLSPHVSLYSGRHVSPQMRLDDRETTQRVSVFVLWEISSRCFVCVSLVYHVSGLFGFWSLRSPMCLVSLCCENHQGVCWELHNGSEMTDAVELIMVCTVSWSE